MASPSVTIAGRISDAVFPPALSLRLRAIWYRRERKGMHAPPRPLLNLVPEGRTAIDVGAHRGLWTYWISRRASTVHAFEPNPDLYAYLSRIKMPSVHAHDVALSDVDGSAVLSIPSGGGAGRGTIEHAAGDHIATVETRRLDSYGLDNVGFVKIDVEGHEEAVIRGAEGMLQEWHPTLVVEIEERHNPGALTRLPAALAELGYSHSYFLLRGRLVTMDQFSVQTHQLDVSSVTSANYVNNFVFTAEPINPAAIHKV